MSIAPFNVEAESVEGGIHVLSITGELDQATADDLRRPAIDAIDRGAIQLMLDMTECGFVDSTGLGVIVETWKTLQERNGASASFAICCAEPDVRRLLELTGLDQAIALRDTREEAITALRG